MNKRPITRRAFLTMAALSGLTLAACRQAAPAAPAAAPKATDAPKAAAPAADKPTIKLGENPWTGSSVNIHVAKQLLESKLGYKVEIVKIEEALQWDPLSKGDLSAVLEVWPSGEVHQKGLKQYVEGDKTVDNIGELGVIGKISWYVPKYVVDAHPELATWEGYKKPENVALFKTAETGDAGQFLAAAPGYVQYDEEIIKSLGLNFKVVPSGSEQAAVAALDAAYAKKAPILMYLWTPHWVHSKYDLVAVKLPDYSAACYAKENEGKKNCDYPNDVLFKIATAKLKETAPDAYAFLKNFKYSNQDQIALMAEVDGAAKKPEDAAKDWIAKNEKVWSGWLAK